MRHLFHCMGCKFQCIDVFLGEVNEGTVHQKGAEVTNEQSCSELYATFIG